MPVRLSAASPALPALALAFALLIALAALGAAILTQMHMVPSTPMSAADSEVLARSAIPLARNNDAAPPPVEAGPGWETLNTPQKLALYPLAARWAYISEPQKLRWLAIAATFAALPEDEQTKFHNRMTDWASLSAQQRNQARLNYATTNKLAKDNKQAQWEAYQALSEAERKALAARAAPKPKGAATAVRPVSAGKLVQVPAALQSNPSRANAPKIAPPAPAPAPAQTPTPKVMEPVLTAPAPTLPAIVETTPVAIPVATPSALPPLDAMPDPLDSHRAAEPPGTPQLAPPASLPISPDPASTTGH